MDRQKFLKLIFPVLMVVAGYVWYINLTGGPSASRDRGAVTAEDTKELAVLRQLTQKYHKLRAAAGTAENEGPWGRDPFYAPEAVPDSLPEVTSTEPEALPEWRLDAVMVDPDGSVAVINGEEVALHARIDGFVVQEITDEGVQLSNGERTVELPL